MRKTAIILTLVLTLAACRTTGQDLALVLAWTNQQRIDHGLVWLNNNARMDLKADGWAEHLASRCILSHSDLSVNNPIGWRLVGENVGYGPDIGTVLDTFLHSPPHRANILRSSWTHMGAGVVWSHCFGQRTVFVVQEFAQLS